MESVDLDSLIGKSLDNRFELKKLIGQGGYGAVFEAVQNSMQRRCAVKVLSFQTEDPKQIARFELEARVTCQLSHPNTIVVYEYGRDENLGVFFIAMEFLDGQSLTDFANSRTLSLEESLHILGQIADSLDDAHTYDLVHRDIKPHNIMIVKRGSDELSVKVIDFGIAKTQEKGLDLTQTDTIIGTPEYMSTEQVLNKKLSGKSDQYALAVTAYFLLTGRTLFNCETALQIAVAHASEIPPALSSVTDRFISAQDFDSILLKALSKDPDERYATCREFVDALADNKPESNPDSSEYPSLREPVLSTKSFEYAVAKTELAPSEQIAKESEERKKTQEKDASVSKTALPDEDIFSPPRSKKGMFFAVLVLAFLGLILGIGFFQRQQSGVAFETNTMEVAVLHPESPKINKIDLVSTPTIVNEKKEEKEVAIGSQTPLSDADKGDAKPKISSQKDNKPASVKSRARPDKRVEKLAKAKAGMSDSVKKTLENVKKGKKGTEVKKNAETKKKIAKGKVKIVTSPWGTIYIDGKKITTRNRYTANLRAGKHVFVLKQNGVAKTTRRLYIEAGDSLRLRLNAD